jgi:hypothetical protein
VAFTENASFKSFGVIYWSPPPFSLPGELSMDKKTVVASFQLKRVCMISHRSIKTTGSSLIIAHWQISFLAISACYKLLTWHCCMAHVILIDTTQSRAMCILVITLWLLCVLGSLLMHAVHFACAEDFAL